MLGLGEILGILFVPIVLIRKRPPVSAIAWSLTVIFIPYLGVLLFLFFGASKVKRRLRRKLFHRSRFLRAWTTSAPQKTWESPEPTWAGMDQYSLKLGAATATPGNQLHFYKDGVEAFKDKFAAIREAQHHIHLEYFILRNDRVGNELTHLLCKKAREGVEVRVLVDGVGSREATPLVRRLRAAGAKASFFLPTLLLAPRFTLSFRNHRKILICDGRAGFTGGLNIGDEYLGRLKRYPYWRDSHLRLTGPAVLALQRVFVEDWDFSSGELLVGDRYFPDPRLDGDARVQMVWSGPDQETNASRETFFAVITAARTRLWIMTPYLVPDTALLTALKCAAIRGVDVRIITQSRPPDHWVTYWAGRYFWDEFLACGIRFFEYTHGMMHAKVMLADGEWGSVGSANLDIRSMRLNFEMNCHIHSTPHVKKLEKQFQNDLAHCREVTTADFNRRSLGMQLCENVCRLFSPLL